MEPDNYLQKIEKLVDKGVTVPDRRNVMIGDEVDLSRVAGKGVTLYPGTRIFGSHTCISEGAQIGVEGPAAIENCWIGPQTELKGGFFSGAVFLKNAICGSGSHVRQGTILEEQASIAHTVGLKQTILFPFVTLGSLINFCDCLMAGGTSRKNHSEVGSSYIHFNFTPNQDKATPSLIGDVPRGVMLDNAPIFLGGQGGLVGPCRLAYGTVIAAGTICRNDQLEENHLVLGAKGRSGSIPYAPGGFIGLKRMLTNNLIYIGNLFALRQWYIHVRSRCVGPDLPEAVFEGLCVTLEGCITERVKQLEKLRRMIDGSERGAGLQQDFVSRWPELEDLFRRAHVFAGSESMQSSFLATFDKKVADCGKSYLDIIHSLATDEKANGTQWLASIVRAFMEQAAGLLPGVASSNSSKP